MNGDERHEQGHVRAPSGEVPYEKDWGGLERASDKVAASLHLLHRVRSMAGEWHRLGVEFVGKGLIWG